MESRTDVEIIEATYRVLCEHGYADLTIQRIADESSLTTAAVHYHFDTKQGLLNAFLGHVVDRFERRLPDESAGPRERLSAFLDAVFAPASTQDDDVPIALMEVTAQAPHQAAYRERLVGLDETMRAVVASAVRDGVAEGHFEAVDPDAVARFVVTAINGGHVRMVAFGEDPAETRALIESRLERWLGWSPAEVA